MENREAIEYIKWMQEKFHSDKSHEACDMAINAMEKQVPMKPLPQEMDIDGHAITPCGFCGEALPKNVLYDFCPFCGQAIDRRTKHDPD